jgi:hypothetical protein
MGFGSLQRSRDRRSTFHGRCRRPLRSACRVWLPSGRFTPSEPVPALFHAGGALGIHPSELPPPGRCPHRFRAEEPTYRLTRRCSRRRSAGPARRGAVSGLLPFRESLAAKRRFSAVAAGCSLGFCPSRVCGRRPRSGFHPDSSHALRGTALTVGNRRRPGVSIGLRLVQSVQSGKPDGEKDSPFRVLAPDAPGHSSESPPGLLVGLVPRHASLPTGRHA